MKLASFIKEYKEDIAEEWVLYAGENIGVTIKMDLTIDFDRPLACIGLSWQNFIKTMVAAHN